MADLLTVKSYTKGVDLAPRKVGIVASLVRNRTVADALVILEHVPRRSSLPLKKAIESARANAINNHGLDGTSLTISTLSVTVGTRLRRFRPASRGRALPFQKKSSNILIEVSGALKPKKKPVTKTTAKPAAEKASNVEEETK